MGGHCAEAGLEVAVFAAGADVFFVEPGLAVLEGTLVARHDRLQMVYLIVILP